LYAEMRHLENGYSCLIFKKYKENNVIDRNVLHSPTTLHTSQDLVRLVF